MAADFTLVANYVTSPVGMPAVPASEIDRLFFTVQSPIITPTNTGSIVYEPMINDTVVTLGRAPIGTEGIPRPGYGFIYPRRGT